MALRWTRRGATAGGEGQASVRMQSPGSAAEDVSDVVIRDRRDHRARSGSGKGPDQS